MHVQSTEERQNAKWTEHADDADYNELPSMRSKAEKWTTTISTLASVSTILTLLQGTDSVKKLAPEVQTALFGILIVALAAGFAAIFMGATAAYGGVSSEKIPFTGESLRNAYKKEVNNAINWLRRSRIAAVIAALLLLAVLTIFWFSPKPAADTPSVLIIQHSGSVLCGELSSKSDGTVMLKPKGSTTPITLLDVDSTTPIDKCP